MASRFYRFGYQGPNYMALWNGYPQAASHRGRSDDLEGMGDVECSQFFQVPQKDEPYAIHKKVDARPAYFYVPPQDSPYYTHKYDWPDPVPFGAITLSDNEKQLAWALGAGAAVWFLFLRKGAKK